MSSATTYRRGGPVTRNGRTHYRHGTRVTARKALIGAAAGATVLMWLTGSGAAGLPAVMFPLLGFGLAAVGLGVLGWRHRAQLVKWAKAAGQARVRTPAAPPRLPVQWSPPPASAAADAAWRRGGQRGPRPAHPSQVDYARRLAARLGQPDPGENPAWSWQQADDEIRRLHKIVRRRRAPVGGGR